MLIDQEKNHASTASLLEQEHIVEVAYKRGLYEFYNGRRVPHEFTPLQEDIVKRRTAAINSGKQRVVDRLTLQLVDQHLEIEDEMDDGMCVGTYGYKFVEASNPYRANTLYALEWQRGFNTGYFRNLNKLKRKS